MSRIVVIGTVGIDRSYVVSAPVKQGEAAIAINYHENWGGKGLNQAIAASKAGAEVIFYTKAGKADCGFLEAFLRETGICEYHVYPIEGPTNHGVIQIPTKGDAAILGCVNENTEFSKEEISAIVDSLHTDDILLLQMEMKCTSEIIKKAKEKSIKVFLNPSPLPLRDKVPFKDLNCVILNHSELVAITGIDDKEHAVSSIFNENKNIIVVLTEGSLGSSFYSSGKKVSSGAYPVEVKDTIGAGDTYTGYLVAGFISGIEIEKNMALASKAASYVVSKVGAAEIIPSIKELEEWR